MRGIALISLMTLAILAAPARAATVDVTVSRFAFAPAELTITQGDVITWTWKGPDTNHSTTTEVEQKPTNWDSDPHNSSPDHAVGDKFSVGFQYTGEFSYHCKVHAAMTGRVVVQPLEVAQPPPPDTVAPAFGPPQVSVKGRTVTFNLDEAGSVEGDLSGPTSRTLKQAGQIGLNILKLPPMKPGRYKLTLRATDASGNESTPASVKFNVPKPKKR